MTTILVIEDETPIREEVMDWLRFEDFEVFGAENGRIGLELAHAKRPQLILCDIAMPDMNGHEVLLTVRSTPELSNIPFIFLTAAADRESMRIGMDLGADDYITKPFTHAEVLNAIQARLQKQAKQENQQQQQVEMLNAAFLEEQKKRLLKSRLLAMFSHDFRNPLTLILMASDILSEGDKFLPPHRKQQQHERIRGSVHRLLQMLDDMLMVAEMESGFLKFTPQTIHLPSLIEQTINEFHLIDQHAHELTFNNQLKRAVPADAKLFRQILTNLLSNALKYSPHQSEICVELYEEDDTLTLEVIDQGIGIPKESFPYLFDPFHRAKNAEHVKGTGLGLTIVKECVEHHQGKIEIYSQLDQGTQFIVRLPLVYAANPTKLSSEPVIKTQIEQAFA
ncbi:MAG: response regulator [Anaerolineales bacterium]|nr:response regulator [Anaerolineales bacterium]